MIRGAGTLLPLEGAVRNVLILALAQVFGACGTIVVVTFGGIVGARIAPTPVLATLPMALAVVGIALATLPATLP